MLEVDNLTVRYGDLTIVDSVSFTVDEGGWLMIVGPNGAGKSTIINAISQAVSYTGEVRFQGRNFETYKPHERARLIGVLAQSNSINYSFTVKEVVRMGRYAHAPGMFSRHDEEGERYVSEAIAMTGLESLLGQSVLTLSGGELRRVFLAQLFAQNPRLLILDEPTNHLDLLYQKQTFSLIQNWLETSGRAVISVVHDLSLAKSFGKQALLLDKGRVKAAGPINETLNARHLDPVYHMDVYAWMRRNLSQWER
ncbi:MAG: ABC transporter ATP-binding protein [Fastidiosipilaceae bacterium]|jgi:iron complex transport system ATP-binding protein